MGWVVKTPEGRYRACWRDPAGTQRAKTLRTKREASAYLAQVGADTARGVYVDPHAARRILFRDYATDWLAGRNVEARTREINTSLLRTHVLPAWGEWPLAKIDHASVQKWTADLAARRAPSTVRATFQVLSMVLEMAVRARLLAVNPCAGVQLPRLRDHTSTMRTVSRTEFRGQLLPAVPEPYRALVAVAAGCGLRWGECVGLAWDAVDLAAREVHVYRVVVETSGRCQVRTYPKSRAGVRRVPLPAFAVDLLAEHRERSRHPGDLVTATRSGNPHRRSTFRRQVWVPTLEQAGIAPGLRFHDLRHSFATWLVSDGVPVNVVQRLMGHESAVTTLNRYVHAPRDYDDRVRRLFGDDDPDNGGAAGALAPEC
ncbi:MAG: tyrosine-type recombinase/integrase [Dermatophilaceae bacterium]